MNTLFAFVLLLSILIFVHELGHFLVARWCGVRVLQFSIGFGRAIGLGSWRLAWKWGDTEYKIGWFPMGGYVKMLGENLDMVQGEAPPAPDARPDEYLENKSLPQKLAIVSAGPAMNLILPVVVFMGMLSAGMPRALPVVGSIEAGSPAEQAGLLEGDRFTSLGAEPVAWWADVEKIVRESAGQSLVFSFEREGEERSASVMLDTRSRFDEFGMPVKAGWLGAAHLRLGTGLGVPSSTSRAGAAGLRSGDRVEAVAGVEVEDWKSFETAYLEQDGDVTLRVLRGEESLEFQVPALGSFEAFGVLPASVLVASVNDGSPAKRGGLEPGDLILSVDGAPIGSFASFAEVVRTSEGRVLALRYARDGEVREAAIAPELAEYDAGMGITEPRYLVGISADVQHLVGAVGTDRERNPLVALPRAVEMTVDVTGTFLRGLVKLVTGDVPRNQIAGPIGIAQIAGSAYEAGWETYLSIMVLISINLGILNLLPIPVLDGGQAVLFIAEGIKRGPLSLRTREFVQQVGFAFLIVLMGFAFWNDISRNWSSFVGWSSGLIDWFSQRGL